MIKLAKKFNAEKLYLIGSAALTVVLATTPASANKSSTPITQTKTFNNNVTYTANGKMSKKMAVMMVNLLRNPHLQVRAQINGQPLQTISPKSTTNSPIDLLTNYTISGKTDRKTALKLKRLIQSGQPIEIQAEAIFKQQSQQVTQAQPRQLPRHTMNRTMNYPMYGNMKGYTPFYSNVTPPTFVQGNTVWVPVLIQKPIAHKSTSSQEMFAAQ